MTLLETIREMVSMDEEIILNDGAYTWDLYNLYDAVRDGYEWLDGADREKAMNEEYAIVDGNIFRVGSDGCLASIPAYFQE